MKFTAATLLLSFVGTLHFDSAVSAYVVAVKMSNNHTVGGTLSSTSRDPDWMSPRENPPVFQGYEAFLRTPRDPRFVSGFLEPRVTISGHNPAREVPTSVEIKLRTQELINDGEFQLYNPAAPPVHMNLVECIFITRQATTDVYWAKVMPKALKNVSYELRVKTLVNMSRHLQSLQRQRYAQQKQK